MNATDDVIAREKEFLDKVYHTYTVDNSPQTMAMRKLIAKTFIPHFRGGHGLELGCSDGFMTEILAGHLDKLDVIDGSRKFIQEAEKRRLKNVTFTYTLFEQYATETKYDCVIASYILEHVLDPIPVLRMARSVLKPDGKLFVVVPNARALSRQWALHMNMLKDLKELTPNDHNHGHRRVYDRVNLNRDLAAAGFEGIAEGGIMLKILADFQMDRLIADQMLTEQHLQGLYSLGLEYPDLCGSLFSVCRIKP